VSLFGCFELLLYTRHYEKRIAAAIEKFQIKEERQLSIEKNRTLESWRPMTTLYSAPQEARKFSRTNNVYIV
jgi:hypothetical protein